MKNICQYLIICILSENDVHIFSSNANVDFRRMERNLRRLKTKVFPKSPMSGAAFNRTVVMDAFGYSRIGEPCSKTFFKGTVWKNTEGCAVFASDAIIALIEENIPVGTRIYAMDATFRIVPCGCFKQLLIIYVRYQRRMYPFLHVLMTNKAQALYKAVFKYIEEDVFKLRPSVFAHDFERAMRLALESIYDEAEHVNCWFHFKQSIRRRASNIPGFFAAINRNDALSQAYHMIMALPLLPAAEIGKTFKMIKLQIEAHEQREVFAPFLRYFESQWLKKVCKYI